MTTNSNAIKKGKQAMLTQDSPHAVTKSDLIESIAEKNKDFSQRDIEQAVKTILEQMSQSLEAGERIEIRGFGSFSLHQRGARTGRNPKTGEAVQLESKNVPHFKPGKELRERVNSTTGQNAPPVSGKSSNGGNQAKVAEDKVSKVSKKSEVAESSESDSQGKTRRGRRPNQQTPS